MSNDEIEGFTFQCEVGEEEKSEKAVKYLNEHPELMPTYDELKAIYGEVYNTTFGVYMAEAYQKAWDIVNQ